MPLPLPRPPARLLVLVAVLLTVLTACSDSPPQSSSPTTSADGSSAGEPEDGGTEGGGTEPALSEFGAAQAVAAGISIPWGLAFLPDGDALVAERTTGRILRVTPDGQQSEEMVVPGVVDMGEGGLLGLAISPDYDTDGLIYAYLTTDEDNRIVRFTLGGQPQVLVDGIDNNSIHNGGRIAFGPDGMLYAGTGDAGTGEAAQDREDLNGKILRMTPDGQAPADNPFPGSVVYTYGHRNVQGLAWDDSGDMYASELGQNTYDEVNLILPGHNYGWPVVEGQGDTDGGRFTNPLVTWPTDESSPSGAAISGDTLYVAALRGERLWTIPITGPGQLGEPVPALQGTYGRLRTVAVAPDGALWLTTSNTSRGTAQAGDDHVYRFPPG